MSENNEHEKCQMCGKPHYCRLLERVGRNAFWFCSHVCRDKFRLKVDTMALREYMETGGWQ